MVQRDVSHRDMRAAGRDPRSKALRRGHRTHIGQIPLRLQQTNGDLAARAHSAPAGRASTRSWRRGSFVQNVRFVVGESDVGPQKTRVRGVAQVFPMKQGGGRRVEADEAGKSEKGGEARSKGPVWKKGLGPVWQEGMVYQRMARKGQHFPHAHDRSRLSVRCVDRSSEGPPALSHSALSVHIGPAPDTTGRRDTRAVSLGRPHDSACDILWPGGHRMAGRKGYTRFCAECGTYNAAGRLECCDCQATLTMQTCRSCGTRNNPPAARKCLRCREPLLTELHSSCWNCAPERNGWNGSVSCVRCRGPGKICKECHQVHGRFGTECCKCRTPFRVEPEKSVRFDFE